MARFGPADVNFLLVGGRNILNDTIQIQDSREALIEETTVLGSAVEEHAYVGVRRYTLSLNGFYNDAAGESDSALVTVGQSVVVMFATEGNTIGKPVVATLMAQADYQRMIERGALHKVSASYVSEQGHDEAVILHALGARTTDDDTEATPVDNGASSANGGTAYLEVEALTLDGYDSVTITVLHDADGAGAFSSLVAFTTVTAAPTGQRVTVAGTVQRYLAVAWDFIGAGTSPSVTFTVGFKRN